jgi:hypothetical protein
MNTLNPQTQLKTHQKLVKILDMINLCQRYLEGDHRTLNTEACTWLSSLKIETEKRIEFRKRVLARLRTYYATQVFALASEVYDSFQFTVDSLLFEQPTLHPSTNCKQETENRKPQTVNP